MKCMTTAGLENVYFTSYNKLRQNIQQPVPDTIPDFILNELLCNQNSS